MGCTQSASTVSSFVPAGGVGVAATASSSAGPSSDGASKTAPSFHEEYVLGRKLGKGAFGSVYLVRRVDGGLEDQAVKVSDLRHPKGDRQGTLDVKRQKAAEKEVTILEAVSGPTHIIRFDTAFFEGTFSYIVMEKCDQTLLQTFERMVNFTELGLKRIFREMLMGVAAVHAASVVHRDVKPDNFLCAGVDCTVKLCDFGLAANISSPKSLELTGVYGTPPFMAPDILNGQRYGATVDTWACGVVVFVLFFGKFPYTPTEPTGPAMKAAILAGTPPPAFRTPPGQPPLSSNALALVQAMLRREVRDRVTAEAALQYAYFTSAEDPNHTYGSLRPMLHAAKRCGAFDLPGGKVGPPKPTELDTRLYALRDRVHANGHPGGAARGGEGEELQKRGAEAEKAADPR